MPGKDYSFGKAPVSAAANEMPGPRKVRQSKSSGEPNWHPIGKGKRLYALMRAGVFPLARDAVITRQLGRKTCLGIGKAINRQRVSRFRSNNLLRCGFRHHRRLW